MPALESLFNKIAGLKACNFIKKRFQHRSFPVNIAKFLRKPILKNICKRLLLSLTTTFPQISLMEEYYFKIMRQSYATVLAPFVKPEIMYKLKAFIL